MRNAFVVLFVTAAVPLAAALGWFASQTAGFRQVSFQLHREVSGLAATTVARHLDVLEGRLEYLRQFYPALSQGAPAAAIVERIQRALRLNPDFLGMTLVERNGREVRRWANSPLMRNFGELERAAEPALARAASTGRPASALAALAQAPAVVAVHPVSKERFVCIAVSLEGLWNELSRHRVGAGGTTVLATSDGRLLPVPGMTLPRVQTHALKTLFESGDRGWSDRIPAPEGAYLGMFERIAGSGLSDWYALTLEPAAEIAPGGGRWLLIGGGFGVLLVGLSLAGAMLLAAPMSQLEAKLKRQLPDLATERELSLAKEEFFLSAAHDFRAPIFGIQGYLRLIEKSVDPEPRVKAYFEAVHQSCEKLTFFVQDILDSARLETGQLKLGVSAVAPRPLLERVQRLFGAMAAEKGIGLEVKVDAAVPDEVDADERLVERVFSNLVSNALTVVPKGGRISLAARPTDGQVEFCVADTGPGIPEGKQAVVFEKYTQLGGGRRGGVGLGLHICRKIVELHRGRMWLESVEGEGTRFFFTLPIRQIV
ncbi:MAG: HAMP domain-containing histidine kinase [Elusimicrobia bacterium]|nr:HAMP domain-containing histidine kinase [Elusimicrobiota bacterium]